MGDFNGFSSSDSGDDCDTPATPIIDSLGETSYIKPDMALISEILEHIDWNPPAAEARKL